MSDASNKRIALLITTCAVFLSPYMGSAVNIAVPSIGTEFQMDAVLLTWIATSYLLASAVFLVPLGKLADIYGRKRLFIIGISIFTVSSLLLTFSTSGEMMILLRVLQGIGGGTIYGTSLSILTSVYPPGERGSILGINTAAVYTGLTAGPFIGGFLTQNFGWRSIFLVTVPIGLILVGLILWKLKGEWAEARGEKLDIKGSTLYGFTLVALMYGFTLLPETSGFLITVVGVMGLLGFIRFEGRVNNPVLDLGLFRNNRIFLFSNLTSLLNHVATYAVVFLLSIYLQQIKGLTPADAGLVLIAQPIVRAFVSPLAGKLSDRVEPRILASLGMAASTIGLSLMAFLDQNTSMEFIVVSLFVLGFGFALFSTPNTNAVMYSIERRFYGVGSATLSTTRLVGQVLSLGIAAVVFAMIIGREPLAPQNHPLFLISFQLLFIIFTVMCAVGVLASLLRGNLRKR